MDRLLGPEETKFWLLDRMGPFNGVLVLRRRGAILLADRVAEHFKLPVAVSDASGRPRWVEARQTGIVAEFEAVDEEEWLQHAEELMALPVGTGDHPCWRMRLLRQRDGATTLLLSMLHALIDMRSAATIGHALLTGGCPAPMPPSFEELLSPRLFAAPDAGDMLEWWWSADAGRRWRATGVERLAAMLPPGTRSRLARVQFDGDETAALAARCRAEGASLNGALAAALHDVMGAAAVGHSIDLRRFIDPPLPSTSPGLAVSHLALPLGGASFWERARGLRAALQRSVRSGAVGDALLTLPRSLSGKHAVGVRPPDAAPATISHSRLADAALNLSGLESSVGVAPARSGAVLTAASARGRLELVAASPVGGAAPLPLAEVVARLRSMT